MNTRRSSWMSGRRSGIYRMKNTSGKRSWKPIHQVLSRLVCVAWLAWATGHASAATMSWTNGAGGDYTNAANWSGGVPGTNDSASFGIHSAAYTVDLTALAFTNNVMNFNAATSGPVTLNLHGNNLSAVSAAYSLNISSTTGSSNTLTVTNGTVAFGGYLCIAPAATANGTLSIYNTTLTGPTLEVAAINGGLIGNGTLNLYNSTVTVNSFAVANSGYANTSGTGTVLIANGSVLTVATASNHGASGSNSVATITVLNGTYNANNGMTLGKDINNVGNLNILDAGQVYINNNLGAGSSDFSYGNILINGANALLSITNSTGLLLKGIGGSISTMTINNGICVLSNGTVFVANNAGTKGKLTMTGGALTMLGSAQGPYIASQAIGTTGEFWMVGNGNPVVNARDYFNVGGGYAGSSAKLVVSNGTITATGRMNVPGIGVSQVLVPGGSIMLGTSLNVGSATGTGMVLVSNSGLLEANTYTVNASSDSTVSNIGGIYQYASASPTITPGTFGNVGIQSGTVSFRGITNADVLCNQSGKPLDSASSMAWVTGGSNTFRLNHATNVTTGQAYSFSTAYGATNFARLELVNSSLYRSNVTLDANGSLYISGGASTISGVLTAAPSSTIEFNLANTNTPACLLASTNVYLNGCTLQLDLANPPVLNTSYLIISNAAAHAISYSFAGGSTKQTFAINGTNYLTSISLAGDGTEVRVRTVIPARGTSVFFH